MKFFYGPFIIVGIVIFLTTVIIWAVLPKSNTPLNQTPESEDIKISEKRTTVGSQKPKRKEEISLQLTTDRDQYEPGETVKITAEIINKSDAEIVSMLDLLISADEPLSKIANDKILHKY